GERDHALELAVVADAAPARVVAVLLASARIAAGGLQVAAGVGAYPHVAVGGRHGERADALERRRVGYAASVGVAVRKSRRGPAAADAGLAVIDVDQSGFLR